MRSFAAVCLVGAFVSVQARSIRQISQPALLEEGSAFTPVNVFTSGFASLGSYHRCTWTGNPDHLEDYLTISQLRDPAQYYFGRDRRRHFFQHLFVDKECSGGAPKGHCLTTLRVGKHCGSPQNWAVLAPNEQDGAGVMWYNEQPCADAEGLEPDATVSADFFCPRESEDVHLHSCVWEGQPEAAPADPAAPANATDTVPGTGRYRHVWAPEDCHNGLPPPSLPGSPPTCVSSLRWAEHCGDDHDWTVHAAGAAPADAAAVSWYTAHAGCDRARVAVDYFCAKGPSGVEFPRRVHACRARTHGKRYGSREDCAKAHASSARAAARLRVAGQTQAAEAVESQAAAARGACLEHVFTDAECVNGLPRGQCVVAQHTFAQCGREQELELSAPLDLAPPSAVVDPRDRMMATGARARWYNARPGGACGPATIGVDYYCFSQCARQCANAGALREDKCTCDCRAGDAKSPWTGPECRQCGLDDGDCVAGQVVDAQACKCVAA